MFCCLLCDNKEMDIIKYKTRNSSHKVVRCKNCNLQQLFPLPTIDEDVIYYDKNPHDKETTPQFDIEQIAKNFYHKTNIV